MKILILAAEGTSLSHGRKIPASLQPMSGEICLLEQQIRILNLCGIDSNNIFIVIGKEGTWKDANYQNKIENHEELNFLFNSKNNSTTSDSSFLLFLESLKEPDSLIVINSDSIFDVRHIERLKNHSINQNKLITRSATSINERGVKLSVSGNNIINLIRNNDIENFPWNLFSGLLFLSKQSLKLLSEKDISKDKDFDGILFLLDEFFGINSFMNISYDSYGNGYEIDSFNSIDLTGGSFASLSRKHIVRKNAKGDGLEKLVWEINWLKNLPYELKKYFPRVIDASIKSDFASFDMPWYELTNLRKKILTGEMNSKTATAFLNEVLDFAFEKLYSKVLNENPPHDWIIKNHFERVTNRLIKFIDDVPSMRNLIREKYIILNKKKYLNLPFLLPDICSREELIDKLKPSSLRFIHGDLHFQNILVGPTKENMPFLLADPRGELNGSDFYYDLGKLWHSFNGLYDLIHTDLFKLDCKDFKNNIFEYRFSNKTFYKIYAEIKSNIYSEIQKYSIIQNDNFWHEKILFSEMMHFCSVMPFHIRNDNEEKRAKMLYLSGVKLMNEFSWFINLNSYKKTDKYSKMLKIDKWKKIILND